MAKTCLLCQSSKVNINKNKSSNSNSNSPTEILCELFDLKNKEDNNNRNVKSGSRSKSKKNDETLTCSTCYDYLKRAKNLLDDFVKIQQQLSEIKNTIKDTILIQIENGILKKDNFSENGFLNSFYNSFNQKVSKIEPEGTGDTEKHEDTDFEDDDQYSPPHQNDDIKIEDIEIRYNDILTSFSDENESEEESSLLKLKSVKRTNQNRVQTRSSSKRPKLSKKDKKDTKDSGVSGEKNNLNVGSSAAKEKIKEKINCDLCPLTFEFKNKYYVHMFQVHGVKALICPEDGCNATFAHHKSLQPHIAKMHKKELLTFKCKKCDQSFAKQHLLNSHMKAKHPGQIFICINKDPDCSREFKNEILYKRHLKTHEEGYNPLICSECGRSFRDKIDLNAHISKSHGDPKFFCPEPDCSFSCISNSSYNRHLRTHSSAKRFICQYCGNKYKLLDSLRTHIQRHEVKLNEDLKFKCDFEGCGKTFLCKAYLEQHKLRHKPKTERKFKCNKCNKTFITKYNLEVHSTIHGGEKNIFCDFPNCKLAFSHPFYLLVHKHKHKLKFKKLRQNDL